MEKDGYMSTNLRWLLESSTLENLKCVACADHMDTPISGVNILDNLDVVKWIKPNELVLSSGYLFMNDERLQLQLIRDLRQVNCAALCIKSRRFFQNIPEPMVNEATQVGLPLIELPFFYSFSDISKVVFDRLYAQRSIRARREQALLSAMSAPLFSDGRLSDMVGCIARHYHTTVLLLSRGGDCIETANFPGREVSLPTRFRPFTMPTMGESVLLSVGGRYRQFLCVTLQGGYGGLFLLDDQNISLRQELSSLQRAAVLISIKLEQRKYQRQSDIHRKDSFIRLLTEDTREMPEEEIIHICETHRFDYQCKRICITFFLDGFGNHHDSKQWRAIIKRCCIDESGLDRDVASVFCCEDSRQVCVFLLAKVPIGNPELTGMAKTFVDAVYQSMDAGACAQLYVGIGHCHQSLYSLTHALEECRSMFELMRKIFPEKQVFSAADCITYQLLREMPVDRLRNVYLDTIDILVEFDRANQTNLLQTLDVFFDCRYNAVQAAKTLYIHRNTLLHRLDKIREILHRDIDSADAATDIYLGLCVYKILYSID